MEEEKRKLAVHQKEESKQMMEMKLQTDEFEKSRTQEDQQKAERLEGTIMLEGTMMLAEDNDLQEREEKQVDRLVTKEAAVLEAECLQKQQDAERRKT